MGTAAIVQEVADLISKAFTLVTPRKGIQRGTQHAYNHAGVMLQAAVAGAQAEQARQALVANLLTVAEGVDIQGMDGATVTQLRAEAYLAAVELLGLAEQPAEQEPDVAVLKHFLDTEDDK